MSSQTALINSEVYPQEDQDIVKNEMILTLDGIGKYFGSFKAVDGLKLEIKKGEIFTLLGPSGCGKTTTLRQIAGLENPDEGKIMLRNSVIAAPNEKFFVPPHKRHMGMVFQSYAIWPHLTVFENVAYPLQARKVSRNEIRKRVMDILELVGLNGMEKRMGPALSGGQQQRVALARALVYEPDILLLDEPFSNLDVKLREQMRIELKLLQRRIGVTVILVTHDQIEALSLSDRVAVMNQGKIEQVGSPQELYERPATPFVRDFIGTSIIMNANVSNVEPNGDIKVVMEGASEQTFMSKNNFVTRAEKGRQVTLSIRPEDVLINSENERDGENQVEGVIDALLFIGDRYECHVVTGSLSFLVYAPRNKKLKEGQKIHLYFPPDVLTVWSK